MFLCMFLLRNLIKSRSRCGEVYQKASKSAILPYFDAQFT